MQNGSDPSCICNSYFKLFVSAVHSSCFVSAVQAVCQRGFKLFVSAVQAVRQRGSFKLFVSAVQMDIGVLIVVYCSLQIEKGSRF